MKIKNSLILIAISAFTVFYSCGSNGEDEPKSYESLCIGSWFDNSQNIGLMLTNDNKGYWFEDNEDKPTKKFSWSVNEEDRQLTLGTEMYDIKKATPKQLILNGINVSKKYALTPYKKNDSSSENDKDKDTSYSYTSKSAKKFYGEWYSAENRYTYFFFSNGEGYYIKKTYDNYGTIYYIWYTWEATSNSLKIRWKGKTDDEDIFEYTLDKGSLEFKKGTFTQKNDVASSSRDYKRPPLDGYICWKGSSAHYPINKAVEKCDHAGLNDNVNYQWLQFFGTNNLLEPNGFIFGYTTPYYEGIDSYWRSGSYSIVSDSGFWRYFGYGYIAGSRTGRLFGTLKVTKSNNVRKYEFISSSVELYFVGTVK